VIIQRATIPPQPNFQNGLKTKEKGKKENTKRVIHATRIKRGFRTQTKKKKRVLTQRRLSAVGIGSPVSHLMMTLTLLFSPISHSQTQKRRTQKRKLESFGRKQGRGTI